MKNKLFNIANAPQYGYINRALGKISKLALVSYKFSLGVQSARAFFVRTISMRPHIFMVELEGNTFECAGNLVSQLTNPFQLHLSQMVMGGEAPKTLGAHTHA
ncbi:hypothetical protein [Acinetobacter modestus]|jgi:hypothetical protein|uniref:Uncharacterized protein n=1 Tax=Acinetobacter modestus TaxID=1776740 RepID=A0ABP2U0G2_9GAMM|nr:hypothetical protein [Acinetobacter modestus]ENU27968.1 hypothetical protein F992_00800 [Acinetobacter modestus]GGA21469.1 hypothetical protein GCM10017554_18140 [Acinetobacter modestus]